MPHPKRRLLRLSLPNGGSAMIIQEQGDHLILIRQSDHAFCPAILAREAGI